MTALQLYLAEFIFAIVLPASWFSASLLVLIIYIRALKILRKTV